MSNYVIGIDIGGTNTDAVLVKDKKVIAKAKSLTTEDVVTGVKNSIEVLEKNTSFTNFYKSISYISIGTTHFINALLEAKNLCRVNVIRLSGPCGNIIEPFELIPDSLKIRIAGNVCLANGGFNYDGKTQITTLDIDGEIKPFVQSSLDKGLRHFVICQTFSNLNNSHELAVSSVIKQMDPLTSVTISSSVGCLGFLERENGAIINEILKPVAYNLLNKLTVVLKSMGFYCAIFMTLNDGTLQSISDSMEYPVKTFVCGMTNSMRGAALLSGLNNALVIDIGGTSTDCGLLINGFPNLSTVRLEINSIVTNLMSPHVESIALGGGSIMSNYDKPDGTIEIGPQSIGKDLISRSLCCGGETLTPTCLAVLKNDLNDFGQLDKLDKISSKALEESDQFIMDKLKFLIDKIRINDDKIPILLIGGGSVIVNSKYNQISELELIRVSHGEVANAVGAAIAQIGLEIDVIVNFDEVSKSEFISNTKNTLKKRLKEKGAIENSIYLAHITELPLAYIPGNVYRMILKCIGDIDVENMSFECHDKIYINCFDNSNEEIISSHNPSNCSNILGRHNAKYCNTDEILIIDEEKLNRIKLGAGMLGCGGGGNGWVSEKIMLTQMKRSMSHQPIVISNMNKFLLDNKDKLVLPIGFAGSPSVVIEKLISIEQIKGVASKLNGYNRSVCSLMCTEIGGMNSVAPLLVSQLTGLPVLDCDGMGRAFPELQMYLPTILGNPYLPITIIDEFGNFTELNPDSKSEMSPKDVENQMRSICIEKGCSVLLICTPILTNDINKYTIKDSYTKSIIIGEELIKNSKSVRLNRYKNLLTMFNGQFYGTWKISDLQRKTSGGFERGFMALKSINSNSDIGRIEFQNEYLVLYINELVVETVPDLICTLLNETCEPIMTEELRYGLVIDILVFKSDPIWKTEKCLNCVAPSCFGYED